VYIVDTNLYIRALTDPAFGSALHDFQQAALSRLWISAVVMYEVLVGARDEAHAERWERWLMRPFRRRDRVLMPKQSTWWLAAEARRLLRKGGGCDGSLRQASFQNDILIAAACREVGATLITANVRDFELIRSVMGFRYVGSFPAN
jgi:predicted nucleic acid-binding protein